MEIRNSRDRKVVAEVYRWSRAGAISGSIEERQNWDRSSSWHNSLFRDLDTGRQWVVYLADQAWPGEVRLVTTSLTAHIPD